MYMSFWNNSAITAADLLDLALKMESVRLQEVPDACTHPYREHEEEDSYYDSVWERTRIKGCWSGFQRMTCLTRALGLLQLVIP